MQAWSSGADYPNIPNPIVQWIIHINSDDLNWLHIHGLMSACRTSNGTWCIYHIFYVLLLAKRHISGQSKQQDLSLFTSGVSSISTFNASVVFMNQIRWSYRAASLTPSPSWSHWSYLFQSHESLEGWRTQYLLVPSQGGPLVMRGHSHRYHAWYS